MAAAMNGIALHGGFIPYGGTFLTFADYSRPAIRLAALMGVRVIHVMTHDSIGLGEDGPTHQPVEHLASLRAIPNLLVFRPARRRRDRGGLGLRVAVADEPVGAVPVAAGVADVPRSGRRAKSGRVRRLCRGRAGGRPRCHLDRHRLRSFNRAARSGAAGERQRPCRRGLGAVLRPVSPAIARIPAPRFSDAFRGSVSKPRSRATGRAGSVRTANSSA